MPSITFKSIVYVLAFSALYMLCAVPAVAAVGETIFVRNDVKGTAIDGQTRQMAIGEQVDLGLKVVTGNKSAARMSFVPKGTLTLGALTQLTIDQPVVDRATGRQTSKLSLGVGWLRVEISHRLGGLEVDTPNAVVGIKGTILHLLVDESGKTTVVFEQGTGLVRSKISGQTTEVPPGQFMEVLPGGISTSPMPIDAPTKALLDRAIADAGGTIPGIESPALAPSAVPGLATAAAAAAAAAGVAIGIESATDSNHHSRRTISP